jgi:DNA-binding transcriptional ArsR family regulator
LRIFSLLERTEQMCVCDLAEALALSVSAISQHLAKMRAYRLVTYRRDAQTLYYTLTDHPLNAIMRTTVAELADESAD